MPSSILLASSRLNSVYFCAYSSPGKYGCHGAGTPWRASPRPRNTLSLIWSRLIASDRAMRKSFVRHHLAHLRIGRVGLVDGDHRIGAAEGRPGDDAILPGLLLLLQDRVVGHVDVALLHVEVAGDGGEVERLRVGEVGEAHLVDIGQLVAGRVDADVVGVAPQREHRIAGPRSPAPRPPWSGVRDSPAARCVLANSSVQVLKPAACDRLVDVRLGGVWPGWNFLR